VEQERLRLEEERLKLEQERIRIEAEKIAEEGKLLQEKKKVEAELKAAQEAEKLVEEKRLKKEQEKIAEASLPKPAEEQPEQPVLFEEKERDCSGLILLKAMDYLLAGSSKFNALINKQLGGVEKETAAFNEGFIYYPLLEKTHAGFSPLAALLGVDIAADKFRDYYSRVQGVKTLPVELSNALAAVFQEIRCLKIIFVDGSFLYLDADFYTTWSTQYTPYDFSACANKVKSDLDKYFLDTRPLVLFMVPGYDFPSKEFMGLILNFNFERNTPQSITLYDNELAEISSLHLTSRKIKYQMVFGLWPWQFVGARTVKSLGEFSPYHLKKLNDDVLLADIQLELTHPESKQKVLLNGCALKNTPPDQTRLVILTNARKGTFKLDELAEMYLCKWPNQEETFQDYSRKVELFTYTAGSQKFLSPDFLKEKLGNPQDTNSVFTIYLELLDLYLKWHFLPMGYEGQDFQTMESRFYNLTAHIVPEENITKITFTLPAGYSYSRDLEYLLRRLNERNIEFYPGKPVKFSL
ncbi:MAG: cell envelope integrity protein TolA, partial [Eubacteriales bacterium]